MTIIWLSAAGVAGTLARYGVGSMLRPWGLSSSAGFAFPWATLVVNVVGSFLFGLVWGLTSGRARPDPIRTIVLVGFLGAFTTFSSYAFESLTLLDQKRTAAAAANIAANNIGAIAAAFAGVWLGRVLTSPGQPPLTS